jgi:hypothetical protein
VVALPCMQVCCSNKRQIRQEECDAAVCRAVLHCTAVGSDPCAVLCTHGPTYH